MDPIHDFVTKVAAKIAEIPAGKEHPHEYFGYFTQYTKLIDSLLECMEAR